MAKPSSKAYGLALALIVPSAGSSASSVQHSDLPPMVISRTAAEYPKEALRARTEGRVEVEISVDRSGHVTAATVVKSTPSGLFDAAAVDAAHKWQFTPLCGPDFPKPFQVRQTIAFSLHSTSPEDVNLYPPQYVNHPTLQLQDGPEGPSLVEPTECKPHKE